MSENENKTIPNDKIKSDKKPNVPNLRFSEFVDIWQKLPLKNFTERIRRKNINNTSNRPLTISAQYGLIDQNDFFDRQIASKDMSGYYLLNNGEFAYNKSYSNEYPLGTVKRLDKYQNGALSSLYICFNPKLNIVNSDFLVHYFETSKWHKGILDIAGEGARNHGLLNMSVDDYFNTQHNIPSLKEQEKISKFLNLIVYRIEIQSKIIEDYKTHKKHLLHTLYNSITSNKKLKLNDICSITTGKLDANAMNPKGIYKFFTCAKEDYYIDTYSFDGESLIISGNGEVGLIKYFKGKFDAYQRTYVLQKFKINPLYVKFALEIELPKKIYKEKNVGAMPYIVLSTLNNIVINVPSCETIEKIANLVSLIDTKIVIEEQILNDYLLQKKFLLSNMFI